MTTKKNKENEMETKISQHKRHKKKLIPPLLQLPNSSPSAWIHDRLPEMLWAVIITGNLERKEALNFFRYIGGFVQKNKEFADITHSALGNLPEKDLKRFIQYTVNFSDKISGILQLLCYYPKIPGFKIWKEILGVPKSGQDINKLSGSILKTFDHQSQEATDCRWVKVLCMVLGDRLKLRTREDVKEILEYPNYGDMTKVRPIIRATEIILQPKDFTWVKYFWKQSYKNTDCIPEEAYSKKIELLRKDLEQQISNRRTHYMKQSKNVRDELIKHFFDTVDSSDLDARKETAFGLSLYGLILFTEINFYNGSHSITGRIALRSLIEVYISFEYLLKKEKEEPKVWNDFYDYGQGQAKIIYLKLRELGVSSSSIDLNDIAIILNEDKWLEYIPINLGQWGNTNLRLMSEEAGIKDIYDKYYSYTSGYVHGTGLAIRESVYQKCLNVLHRFHRIPIFDLPMRPSVVQDSIEVVNKILDCLNKAYPTIVSRIDIYKEKKKK